MGKRSSRIAAAKRSNAGKGRELEAQHKRKGWDDILTRRSRRQGKATMMMGSASDRMPFGIEPDTSPAATKRRLWPNA